MNDQAIADVSVQTSEDLLGNDEKGKYYYRVAVENKGGLIMPIKMEVTYGDGSTERMSIPAEVWRLNEKSFTKGFFSDKLVTKVVLDPDEALTDVDTENNVWTPVDPEGTAPQTLDDSND